MSASTNGKAALPTFTPGPWRVRISLADQTYTHICSDADNSIACTKSEENARLIAAAPELLEALVLLHNNLAEYQRINNIGGYDNHDMKMARAAIAKCGIPDSNRKLGD